MALWRVHVELEDRPGRLGELATAVGAVGCNILSLHVVGEPTDDGSVTDELLVRMPESADPAALLDAVRGAGVSCTLMVPADATELADTATTALALARLVAADPGSAPRAVATLLRARLADPSGQATPAEDTCTLRIGAQLLRLVRAWPFTATEISRAAALLELAAQLEMRNPSRPVGAERIVLLRDGSEVQIRRAEPSDAPLVAALHARCSPESRRSRFLSPTPRLSPVELRELLGGELRLGVAELAVTVDGGSAVGIANLHPERADAARFAVLVDDAWQGRGLGTALLRRIADTATGQGALQLVGTARSGDHGLARLLRRAGLQPSAELVRGEVRLSAPLPTPVG
ncbi:MAG TPA: GNAT family N-acetyltransferase [Pseudonocardia sp.]|nr:GNAT family N-acetyltransferase [Pseudonocardia sp.]